MKTIHTAAIDLGATSGRVIVGNYSEGRLELNEAHRFANGFNEVRGSCYWDVPGLYSRIREGLRKAREIAPALASCGVDTWAVDHVLLDGDGRLVFPAHAYRDERTLPYVEKLAANGIDRVYDWTGIPNQAINTSLQLQELLERYPALPEIARRCLMLSDYFNFLLSGTAVNEISNASSTQLLDVRGTDYSAEALDFFGIPGSWFEGPVKAGRKLGPVVDIGELEKTEVILVPGHDTACAFDAMPADPGGTDLYLSSGTWSLVGFESNEPVIGPEAQAASVANERIGDGRYRPIRNIMGLWLLEQTLSAFRERPRSDREWEELVAAAEAESAPANLIDVTDPAFFNPASMKEAVDSHLEKRSIKPPTSLPGYTRLICESLGAGHAQAARTFEKLTGRRFQRMLVVGGGSRNRLLCQATANHAGMTVVSFKLEGTAVGNIANQLIALGEVANLSQFRASLADQLEGTTYEPA